MTPSRFRSTAPLRTAVVIAFLLGVVSAPLRTCASHPGHLHGAVAHTGHHASSELGHLGHARPDPIGVPASDDQDHDAAQVGCECLGSCQLEGPPALPHGAEMLVAARPEFAERSGLDRDVAPTPGATHAAPQPRGPPALV